MVMFGSIPCPSDQILPTTTMTPRIDYFLHRVVFFQPICCEYRLWFLEFTVGKETGIIQYKRFEFGCVEVG